MAFSVNNETKIGALTAITITLFILGFNFLKGKSPLKGSTYLYARFEDIADLKPANPVMMNGLAVGKVYETAPGDAQMNTVLVTIRLTEKILIPTNSIATIKGNPLGTPAVEITKGDAQTFLKKGDTLQTGANGGLLGTVMEKLGPTQKSLENALGGMDTLLQKVNGTLTPSVQQDLQATISHLAITTAKLSATVDAVNKLVASQNATIANTLKNAETFSSGLAETKGKLPAITNNLETATQKLSSLELDKTINQLNKTMAALDASVQKLNTNDNTLGALLNDKRIYNNLVSITNSLNLLLQDLRLHPKRYVNVSVFGKKDKTQPLMKPMAEDSLTQEQIRQIP